jgi:hypothetical protein
MRFAQKQPATGRATRAGAALRQLASTIACNSSWNAIGSANPGTTRNFLNGIAAIAPNDVWAVGAFLTGSSVFQTLAEHWDGSAWSVVSTPNVLAGNNILTAVTAIGTGDVWAVGYSRSGNSQTPAQPLTEHWNGNGWTVVPTPGGPNQSTGLYAVGADAANDIWAVGISLVSPPGLSGQRASAWVLHWNGSSWSSGTVVPNFPIGSSTTRDVASVNGVKVLAANNVWMVGDAQNYNSSGPSGPDSAFIEHWDGSTVTQYAAPSHPNGDFLSDVQGTANDLWAVGGQATSVTTDTVVIERWNGTSWSDIGSSIPPAPPDQSANLFALAYVSPTNVWAVGARSYQSPGTTIELDDTLVEQWDGSSWYPVISGNPASSQGLFTIAALSSNDVWAGGSMSGNGFEWTLTENFCLPPTVTSIVPSSGNAGDTVVIKGSGFSPAIDVEFGTTPAFTFHVDSDTQITATSPGHRPGTVDIRVTVQGTSATSSADQFTYQLSRTGSAAQPGPAHFQSPTIAPPPAPASLVPRPRAIARSAPIPI